MAMNMWWHLLYVRVVTSSVNDNSIEEVDRNGAEGLSKPVECVYGSVLGYIKDYIDGK